MLRKKKGLDLITSCDQVVNFHFGGLAATFPTVACAGLNEVIQGLLASLAALIMEIVDQETAVS